VDLVEQSFLQLCLLNVLSPQHIRDMFANLLAAEHEHRLKVTRILRS
jgi:hypothetical protein